MKDWKAAVLYILIGVVLASFAFYIYMRPEPAPALVLQTLNTLTPIPTATSVPIQVHVLGEVVNPGVYTLPAGSRVADALKAAGGGKPDSSLYRLNLAALLVDGQRVYVPSNAELIDQETDSADENTNLSGKININTASINQLISLPGIGMMKAGEIILYRNDHGDFQTLEALMDVPGIGPGTFEDLKDKITIGP